MTESTLTMFVWTIFAAILAAAVYSFAVQRVLSGFVGRLIKADADAPEKAKTLKQLGYTGCGSVVSCSDVRSGRLTACTCRDRLHAADARLKQHGAALCRKGGAFLLSSGRKPLQKL